MKVHDLEIIRNLPFEEYLKLPYHSFSTIKNYGKAFAPTRKMQLGSSVDNYLNEQARFDGDISIIKPLANLLLEKVGDLYPIFEKQLTMIATIEHNGYAIRIRMRPDWIILGKIVIDIKVAERIERTLVYFKYPDQISGYAIVGGCQTGFLLSVSPVEIDPNTGMNRVVNNIITPSHKWWDEKIVRYGKQIKRFI